MHEVICLPIARKQLENIVDYIAIESTVPKVAFDFIEAVDKEAKSLAEMAYHHPKYHANFAVLEEVWWISVKNYNVFNKVFEEDKTVEIRRVLHQLQDSENGSNHSKNRIGEGNWNDCCYQW